MKQFKIGHSYYMRSIGDHDCVWGYIVTARTKSTITIRQLGRLEQNTYRISKQTSIYRNAESVYPLGRYSLCPILSADHELALQAEESRV